MFHYLHLLAADAPGVWAGPSSTILPPAPGPVVTWGLPRRLSCDPLSPSACPQLGPLFKICSPEFISLLSPGPPPPQGTVLLQSQERQLSPGGGLPESWCFTRSAASLSPRGAGRQRKRPPARWTNSREAENRGENPHASPAVCKWREAQRGKETPRVRAGGTRSPSPREVRGWK